MASQSLNHSDESVPADQAAVEDPNHGRYPHHPIDEDAIHREVNVDELSESDFDGMEDSGLAYIDHDYMGSNPNAKCLPDQGQFPIIQGVTDQYLKGETDDPTTTERTDNRLPSAATPIAASGSVVRKPQMSGGTVFRPVKGEDYVRASSQQLPLPPKSVSWKGPTSVTLPKKSGRPPKNEASGDRLMGRAMVKAGIQAQHVQMQPHHHLQGMQSMHDLGLTVRGAAPLVTPARGQKIMPRGRPTAGPRREPADDGSGGYPMMPAPQAVPTYRPVSPKKAVQFRSAQAAEEAHTREMMEAAQNALAPSNVTIGHGVMVTAQNEQQLPVVLPVQHQQQQQQQQQQLQPPHLDDGDLPRTPGKGHAYSPITSPLTGARRSISESQEMNIHMLQEPLRTNPDGLPVTPGGGRKTPVRSRTPRSRMSISESTPTGSQAPSPQRPYVSPQRPPYVSPIRQPHVVLQPRSLHLSPQRPMMQGGLIKSPSSGPNLSLAAGPSTMASAQLQMSSTAPMPSLHNQAFPQPPVVQRHVGPSPTRGYYDVPGAHAAPLVTGSGSTTYTPRRRKEKEPDEAVEAEVNRNVKNILQAEKTHRLSTTSSHTLSPRNEDSDDDEIHRGRHVEQFVQEKKRTGKRTPQKVAKRAGREERREESEEEGEEGDDDWEIVCICGTTEDDGEEMVACDMCKFRWEHVDCIFPRTKQAPEGNYTCHVCWPRPTELTPEQARAYQDRVQAQKRRGEEEETKRKLQERVKRKEENSRKVPSSVPRSVPSKGAASKHDKSAPSHHQEIEKNQYSANAKRLLNISRHQGVTGDAEILRILRNTPRVRSLVVAPNVHGLVAIADVSAGSYLAELCGYVTLQKDCANRNLAPGSLNDLTFLFEKDGVKLIIDARKSGNFASHVRRSCKPNAELQEIVSGSDLHIMIKAKDGVEIKRMEEVGIPFEDDWMRHPRPAQGCTCRDEQLKTCAIELFFNPPKHGQRVAVPSRRSLPTNGTTPKGARSPIRHAVTEKKKSASTKKVSAKKGRKKGTIKLPRHSRKSKGGSTSTAEESEGEEDTEKEYEESTADEKEKEEVKEEKEEKTPRRGRRSTGSTSEGKEREKEGQAMPVVSPIRSSTRIRNDSEVKKEVEIAEKEEKNEEEKKKNVDRSESETGGSRKGGRKSGVEKEKEIKEEIKEEPRSPSVAKSGKKPWPKMEYTLPSERNKPSREERKNQAIFASIAKNEKSEKKGRASSSRGRSAAATPAAPPKEEKAVSTGSARGKRKTENEDDAARADAATAAASTPILAPPRKRLAEERGREKEKGSPAPSSLSSMTSMKEETAASPAPSGMKKKLLMRHQQEQKEKAEAAAKEESGTSTPTRAKRKKEERGAVEALLNMGGERGFKEEMKRHALQLKGTLKPTPFSFEGMTAPSGSRTMATPSAPSAPSTSTAGPSTPPIPPPAPVTAPAAPVSPAPTAATPVESAKAVRKGLSIEEYKKRRQTGESASVGEKKEESARREQPPKKSFMPSADTSFVPSSLPHVDLPGLEETPGLDELKRRVYGETPRRGGGGGGASSSTAPLGGRTEPVPKRQSINDRLKNEFSLPMLSASSVSTPTAAAAPAAPAAVAPSISPAPTGGQLTPSSGRPHKNRLSDARAMNVAPPGLIECPPPASVNPSPTATRTPSNSVTPSTSSSSFFQKAGAVRSNK